jgi:Uma2 family endonuclease
MSRALLLVLEAALRGTELEVVYAPFNVVLGPKIVEPDVLVARTADFATRDLPTAPLLVVEIRSPSTAWIDEGRKRSLYEEHGVASYWLVDPAAPAITILELVDGHYVEGAHAVGDQTITVTSPVPVTLNPAHLARG